MTWQDHAACSSEDPDLWFPIGADHAVSQTKRAKRVCYRCPVMPECRTYALTHHERHGVWGGLTEREREDILRARTHRPAAARA